MRFTPLETVEITQWDLKKAGVWEEAKLRFGLTEEHKVVRVIKGTRFHPQRKEKSNVLDYLNAIQGAP